jgi:hypothetical protein
LYDPPPGKWREGNVRFVTKSVERRQEVGKWQIDPHTALFAGYGHFFPGPFVDETGRDAATDFVDLTLRYTF